MGDSFVIWVWDFGLHPAVGGMVWVGLPKSQLEMFLTLDF